MLSLNTVTVRQQGDLLAIVDACLRHGIHAISPWRSQVAAVGLGKVVRAVRDSGMALSGYCRAGMFAADPAMRDSVRDDNRRAVDEALELGAFSLVVVAGGLPQFSRPGSAPSKDIVATRRHAVDEIGILFGYAKSCGMKLALEPLHPMHAANRCCVNTLQQALDICDALDPDANGALGVAVDVYHTWWDPGLPDQIRRAGRDRLLAFHVCDWLVPTHDPLEDRGMMGEGIIEIARMRTWMEDAGYAGFDEVEILSRRWWSRPMDEVLATCIAAHKASA